jgi:methionyl-tRNA formyltransferase
MRIIIAGFYTPPIHAIQYLFQEGIKPENIGLLTHDIERNQTLIEFAKANCIETKFYQIKTQEALDWVKNFEPDVMFSLYYRDIIPHSILDIPPLGAINLHPSLLPKYRGTFAAPWVIINGEKSAGFTYHYILATVDTGNIILQKRVAVRQDDTALALYNRLLVEGTGSFNRVFDLVTKDHYQGRPQKGKSSYFGRKVPFAGYINPSWSIEQIDRYIRAMYFPPYKGALVHLTDGNVKEVNTYSEYQALLDGGNVQLGQEQ